MSSWCCPRPACVRPTVVLVAGAATDANLIALTPVSASVNSLQLVLADNRAGGAAVTGCCGGPAPAGADACCVQDADAKAAGQDGCGCGAAESASAAPAPVAAAGGCCG